MILEVEHAEFIYEVVALGAETFDEPAGSCTHFEQALNRVISITESTPAPEF